MEIHDLCRRLDDRIDGMKDNLLRTVQDLVRIPSIIGQERMAQTFMEGQYRLLGLKTVRFQPDIRKVKAHPAFIETGMPYEGRPNVIGTWEGKSGGPSLILNGHIDVVSPEPVQGWSHDPWGGEIVGDRMYGRGAGDMKGGLLANYFALKAVLEEGFRPKGTVMLQSVIDEEGGGSGGTLACLMEGYRGDAMICTEPHALNITIAHAGVNYFRVKVLGKSAHAGLAHLSVNAIGKMFLIYQALTELDEKRGREVHFPLFEKGSGRACHLSIGTIRGGDWPSTVAGSAEMEGRISHVPGEKMSDIKRIVAETIGHAAVRDPWLSQHPPGIEWFGWQADPWYQDPGHPLVQTLKGAAEGVLGREPEFIGRAAGLDTRFSQAFNFPSAGTGPIAGNIHGIDEYVEIPSLIQVTKVLARTLVTWCGYEPTK